MLKDGLVVGMVFSGDIERSGIVYSLMKDRVDVTGFAEALVRDDFGLASLPEEIWRARLDAPAAGPPGPPLRRVPESVSREPRR